MRRGSDSAVFGYSRTVSNVRILVTGATGYVGSRLVTALLDEGHDVVAATRNPARLADFGWHDRVTGVALDAHNQESARHAFDAAGPIDVVYYLVHGIGQPGFREADNSAAATVANAAKDGRRAPDRVPGRVRTRRRQPLRASDQPRRGRARR